MSALPAYRESQFYTLLWLIIGVVALTFAQGSGIHGSRQERRFNTQTGGAAVLLTLRDGRRMALGSPDAERLAAFIRARLPA